MLTDIQEVTSSLTCDPKNAKSILGEFKRKTIRDNIVQGIYLTDLNSNHDIYEDYVDYEYGVADNYGQILEEHSEILDSDLEFVVFMTSIKKSEQDKNGGWRWHKWGRYIGNQDPQHEYLYDEEKIEEIYVYYIYCLDRGKITIEATNIKNNAKMLFNKFSDIQEVISSLTCDPKEAKSFLGENNLMISKEEVLKMICLETQERNSLMSFSLLKQSSFANEKKD